MDEGKREQGKNKGGVEGGKEGGEVVEEEKAGEVKAEKMGDGDSDGDSDGDTDGDADCGSNGDGPLHHHQMDVAVETWNPPQYQSLLQSQTHHKSFQEPPQLCT